MYLLLQPNAISKSRYDKIFKSAHAPAVPANHYGLEAKPKIETQNLEERRAANERELNRLRARAEELRLKKRDLLHSDAEGNLVYNIEVAQYNAAVEKALAEKNALATSR